jgi:hypothetical protein
VTPASVEDVKERLLRLTLVRSASSQGQAIGRCYVVIKLRVRELLIHTVQ